MLSLPFMVLSICMQHLEFILFLWKAIIFWWLWFGNGSVGQIWMMTVLLAGEHPMYIWLPDSIWILKKPSKQVWILKKPSKQVWSISKHLKLFLNAFKHFGTLWNNFWILWTSLVSQYYRAGYTYLLCLLQDDWLINHLVQAEFKVRGKKKNMNEILASFWHCPITSCITSCKCFFFAFQLQTLLDLSLSL